jgi:hypothetical protein
VKGKDCIAGGTLSFNVRDDYAFDIDETVWLDLELYVQSSGGNLSVGYNRSDETLGDNKQIQLGPETRSHWDRQSITLERARFANLGLGGSDFSISGTDTGGEVSHEFAICSLSLRRSYTTPVGKAFRWIGIEVLDEHGQPTPARVGLYDASGRMPLPSDEAIVLRKSVGWSRVIAPIGLVVPPWLVKNRSVFYTDGFYHSRLATGEYELIVAKGPEYRLVRQRLTVESGKTQAIKVRLLRWIDMAGQQWYSGDDHIHYARESAHDDRALQRFALAEDLRVANVLLAGNIARSYFDQYDWHPVASDREPSFVLVPGQEDPRTTVRGHTIHLNIREPARDPTRYLLYHEVFENTRAQGGLTGYAHVSSGGFETMNAATGLALDVPCGLVDFVEILSWEKTPDSTWFDFLNLGYKLSPTAGTDYMGYGAIGSVRNYVHVPDRFSLQAWFDGLKKGRTFRRGHLPCWRSCSSCAVPVNTPSYVRVARCSGVHWTKRRSTKPKARSTSPCTAAPTPSPRRSTMRLRRQGAGQRGSHCSALPWHSLGACLAGGSGASSSKPNDRQGVGILNMALVGHWGESKVADCMLSLASHLAARGVFSTTRPSSMPGRLGKRRRRDGNPA